VTAQEQTELVTALVEGRAAPEGCPRPAARVSKTDMRSSLVLLLAMASAGRRSDRAAPPPPPDAFDGGIEVDAVTPDDATSPESRIAIEPDAPGDLPATEVGAATDAGAPEASPPDASAAGLCDVRVSPATAASSLLV
jgi:hypothetical protein